MTASSLRISVIFLGLRTLYFISFHDSSRLLSSKQRGVCWCPVVWHSLTQPLTVLLYLDLNFAIHVYSYFSFPTDTYEAQRFLVFCPTACILDNRWDLLTRLRAIPPQSREKRFIRPRCHPLGLLKTQSMGWKPYSYLSNFPEHDFQRRPAVFSEPAKNTEENIVAIVYLI